MALSIVLLGVTVYLFTLVPKGFLPNEDQGRFNINTEAAEGISFDDMVKHQLQLAEIVMAEPDIAGVAHNVGLVGNNAAGGVNSRPVLRRADAARSAHALGGRRDRVAAAEAGAGSRHPRVPGQSAADQPWRRRQTADLPVHAAGRRHRGAVSMGAGARAAGPADSRAAGRQQRPAAEYAAGVGRDGSRQAVDAWTQRQPGRERAAQRLRRPAGDADLRAEQSVSGGAARGAGVPERSVGDVAAATSDRTAAG